MGRQTGFLMAKAGEVSTHGVCHSLTQFSEMEFIFFNSGSAKSVGWLCIGKKHQRLGLAWHLPESDAPVLQGWEPPVLGARGP